MLYSLDGRVMICPSSKWRVADLEFDSEIGSKNVKRSI